NPLVAELHPAANRLQGRELRLVAAEKRQRCGHPTPDPVAGDPVYLSLRGVWPAVLVEVHLTLRGKAPSKVLHRVEGDPAVLGQVVPGDRKAKRSFQLSLGAGLGCRLRRRRAGGGHLQGEESGSANCQEVVVADVEVVVEGYRRRKERETAAELCHVL